LKEASFNQIKANRIPEERKGKQKKLIESKRSYWTPKNINAVTM